MRISESELARDLHTVLEKVRNGAEVIVEQDHRAVAVIRAPEMKGRPIDGYIEAALKYEARLGYAPTPDPGYAADVQAAIDAHREPLEPPEWE